MTTLIYILISCNVFATGFYIGTVETKQRVFGYIDLLFFLLFGFTSVVYAIIGLPIFMIKEEKKKRKEKKEKKEIEKDEPLTTI